MRPAARCAPFGAEKPLTADERDDAGVGRAEALGPSDLLVEIASHLEPDGRLNPRPSAVVRITHMPTRLVVSCAVHSTQIANHRDALRELTAQVIAARARPRS